MSQSEPRKNKISAPPKPTYEAFEEYGGNAASAHDDLAAQPWAAEGADVDDLGERKTTVNDLAGGGVRVTEGKKTFTRKTGPDGKVLVESNDGDGNTFTRTLYSEGGLSEGYMNNYQRVLAMRQSLIMHRDDPYYRAIIDGFVFFIIGKGLSFTARDENPAVQQHLEDFWRENRMDGRDAEIVRRYLKFGEVLIRYFKNGASGALAKAPRVRLVPFWRVDEIQVDAKDPELLKAIKMTSFNPGGYSSAAPELVPADEVQYVVHSENEGGRGEPLFLTIMRACKWYSDFTLNRVVLNRYRTAFVLFKKITGTPGQVAGVKSADPNATKSGATGKLEKRLPKPGSVLTHNDAVEYEFKSPNIAAGDAKPDGDALRRYICAGGMVPEFLLGDATQANKDNSLVSDTPFVRKVEYFQDFFEGVFSEMFKRVIEQGIAAGKIPKTSTETQITESAAVMRGLRRVLHRLGIQEADAKGNLTSTKSVPTSTEVDYEWPTLIKKNELEEAQTLVLHQKMGLASTETLQAKTGYDHDLEEVRMKDDVEKQRANDAYDMARQQEIDSNSGEPGDANDHAAAK